NADTNPETLVKGKSYDAARTGSSSSLSPIRRRRQWRPGREGEGDGSGSGRRPIDGTQARARVGPRRDPDRHAGGRQPGGRDSGCLVRGQAMGVAERGYGSVVIAVIVEPRDPGRVGRARVSERNHRDEPGDEEHRDETRTQEGARHGLGPHAPPGSKSDARSRATVFRGSALNPERFRT